MQMQQRDMSDVPSSRNSQKREKSSPEQSLLSWLPSIFSPHNASKPKTGLKNCPKIFPTLYNLSSLNRELLNHNLHLDLHDEGGPLNVEAGGPVDLPDGSGRAYLPSRATSTNLCLVIVGNFENWSWLNQFKILANSFADLLSFTHDRTKYKLRIGPYECKHKYKYKHMWKYTSTTNTLPQHKYVSGIAEIEHFWNLDVSRKTAHFQTLPQGNKNPFICKFFASLQRKTQKKLFFKGVNSVYWGPDLSRRFLFTTEHWIFFSE